MKKYPLCIATKNKNKSLELKSTLSEVFKISNLELVNDIEENGMSYFENAVKKAIFYKKFSPYPVIADDSGLEVEVLDSMPGVYSSRFGGENLTYEEKWRYLYTELKKYDSSNWKAKFKCVLCYYDGKNVPVFFEGIVEGFIAHQPKGKNGFGYDPIFYFPDLKKTFGELLPEEKKEVSHRSKACRKFLEWFLAKSSAPV